jgi:hypothetical protein
MDLVGFIVTILFILLLVASILIPQIQQRRKEED